MNAADAPRPRRVRPYPLDELPRILRGQVALAQSFSLHLTALLANAQGATPQGIARLADRLGGVLHMRPRESYLAPSDRLRHLLSGSVQVDGMTLGPASQFFRLAAEEALCQACAVPDSPSLAQVVAQALAGAPLHVLTRGAASDKTPVDETLLRGLLVLDVDVSIGSHRGWLRILTSPALRLSQPMSWPVSAQLWSRRHKLSALQTTLVIEAGYGFLPAATLLALAPGDIVLLDHFGPRPVTGGPVWLRLGSGVVPGYLDGAGVTVIGSFCPRDQPMPDETPASPASSPSAPPATDAVLRELPVQVICEIGRVTLSAREVLELRAGAVLPVGRPLAGPVDLTAGGRLLARGELVDVEGEIGIRVTEIVD